jgi:threonine/homoserine/homoserine lactone efflux protein
MNHLIPPWPLFSAFIVASFVLAITPGPAVFYIVTRSVTQGRASGLASVAGVALGNLGNAVAAAIGLAALFAISSLAFSLVKYLGAAYLFYLGIRALWAREEASAEAEFVSAPLARIFRDGFVVALFNPKTTIFFAAFLPQFMHAGPSPLQSIVLGALFVGIASITDTLYALTAGSAASYLRKARGLRAAGRYVSAAAFIGLGLLTAFSNLNKTLAAAQ